MKKHAKIFLAIVVMIISGAMLGYAAFPVASQGSAVTVTNAVASAQQTEQAPESVVRQAQPVLDNHLHGHKKTNKSQVVALILCVLVGGLGIHRFYLGYIWQGIVQLLTAGGCGIWALIDLIRIITGDLEPKAGRYGKTL
jgi:hypothetical protein